MRISPTTRSRTISSTDPGAAHAGRTARRKPAATRVRRTAGAASPWRTPRTHSVPAAQSGALRVFVVEDAALVLEILLELLGDVPHLSVVGTAACESTAVAAVPALHCDVVITDIQLRTGSGLGVLRRLGAAGAAGRTKFIMFSNCADESYRRLAARLGAFDFFDKASGPSALLSTMRDLAGSARRSVACRLQPGVDAYPHYRSMIMDSTRPNDSSKKTEDLSNTAHETIDRVADSAHPAVDRLAERAHDAVQRAATAATAATDNVAQQSEHLRELKDSFAQDCREYVQANPFRALAYAAVAGFVLTRLMRD